MHRYPLSVGLLPEFDPLYTLSLFSAKSIGTP